MVSGMLYHQTTARNGLARALTHFNTQNPCHKMVYTFLTNTSSQYLEKSLGFEFVGRAEAAYHASCQLVRNAWPLAFPVADPQLKVTVLCVAEIMPQHTITK